MTVSEIDLEVYPRPRPVPLPVDIRTPVAVLGFAFKETTGTASAEVDILDGADAANTDVIPITLTANQSTSEWFGPQGIGFRNGVNAKTVSGTVAGSVFIVSLA